MAMSAMSVQDDPVPVLAATTRDQRESDRFESFRDALCDVYLGIRPERPSSGTFDADVLAYDWEGTILSRMRAPGHEARRDAASLARVPDDALFVNVSVRTIQNDFRASGETFRDWLLGARLDAARERLRSPAWHGRSIEAIAAASGFRDTAHFHHAFRDRFDATPGSLRP